MKSMTADIIDRTRPQGILVIGAEGMLGSHLAAHLEAAGNVVWRTSRQTRPETGRYVTLDLAAEAAFRSLPAVRLSAAILCAGVTSIERCRAEPERTAGVNVRGTIALVRALAARGVFVAFPSSNLVFDGTRPHRREDEPVCPRTEYGRQKALVEKELLTLGPSVAIVRFTKILGPEMPLIRGWIDDLLVGREIHPFLDMVMAPVTHEFAARVLATIAERRLSGVFHVSARQDTSYAEVARRLAEHLRVRSSLVVPVSSRTRGFVPEAVPAHTTLDTARLRSILGMTPPDAWEAVEATFDLMCSAMPMNPKPQVDELLHT